MAIDPATLVLPPADLARAYGLANPTQDELDRIAEAIADAQADVEGELNRPLIPQQKTLTGISPRIGVDLYRYDAWPDAEQYDDDVEVVSMVSYPDGSYDVTFNVGLDGPGTRPIVRYVKAHAVRGLREDDTYGFPLKRVVNSLSAEGQSIEFEKRPEQEGVAGALPTMKSLRQFKRRAMFRRNRAQTDLWPNMGRRWRV